MYGELVRMRVMPEMNTPRRFDHNELMRLVGKTMQPEFVRLWLYKPESGLMRINADHRRLRS